MSLTAYENFLTQALQWLSTGGIKIVLIIIGILFVLSLMKKGIKKLQIVLAGTFPDEAQIKRTSTLTHVLSDSVRIIVVLVGIMMVLSELGIDLGPLLMAAGIGGVAIGFGAQSLVKDIISGFFILLENQIRVGDVVTASGTTALVEEVRLRTIRMRDLSGNVHIIPNGMIDKVTNWTKEFSYYVFNLGIAYRENADEVMALIKDLGAELKADPEFGPKILEPLEMLGVDAFADSAVILKFRIKTIPINQWTVGREMNRRIKNAFDARGIEIPFPHRTIYWGEPKEGTAPPLQVVSLSS